jgi:uncharacterized protein YlxW (UPF0749 family)
VLAGLLFALSARAATGSDLRDAPGLRGMLTTRDRQVAELEDYNAELAGQVAELLELAGQDATALDPALALAAGATAVAGPGLEITLDDAQGLDAIATETNPAERLVHQQDIDAVMNALWTGGAEAMTVQGHRITSNTAVKCVGNVILVAGRVYSPPYLIAAIGPESEMRRALDAAPLVGAYRERAARLGLTWSASGKDNLELPADATALGSLRYAGATDHAPTESAP